MFAGEESDRIDPLGKSSQTACRFNVTKGIGNFRGVRRVVAVCREKIAVSDSSRETPEGTKICAVAQHMQVPRHIHRGS